MSPGDGSVRSKVKLPQTTTTTTVTDTFSNESNQFTRSTTTNGPFDYSIPHYLRGSSVSKDIFYLVVDDYNASDQFDIYYYDFSNNTLNLLGVTWDYFFTSHRTKALIQTRDVTAADETEIGGSFSDVDVRVTAIKTT